MDGDRAIGACDADVDVQAERVVAPDDVAQQLVVASVVRRVDDALVLPAAPWMRGGAAEPDPQLAGDGMKLRAPLSHRRSRGAEALAATRAHLDLGCDQLAHDVRRQVGLDRRAVQLLEAVGQLERVGIEQRELLLDGERQVGPVVERRARLRDQLLPRDALFVAHRRSLAADRSDDRLQQPLGARSTTTSGRRRPARLRAAVSSWSARDSARSRSSLRGEVARIARLEGREALEPLRVRLLEPGRDLGETRVAGDEGRRPSRRGFRSDHPERLREDRRNDRHVGQRQQMNEMPVLERAREQRSRRRQLFEHPAIRAEADDHEPRIDPGHRLEQHLHAFLLDQLPEVDDRRLVSGEELGEPLGVRGVGQPLLCVPRVRRIEPRLREQAGERLAAILQPELVDVDARRHLLHLG